MKTLYDYLMEEESGIGATPANTIGAGEPDIDELAHAVDGGMPKGETRLFKRKRKKKNGHREYVMVADEPRKV